MRRSSPSEHRPNFLSFLFCLLLSSSLSLPQIAVVMAETTKPVGADTAAQQLEEAAVKEETTKPVGTEEEAAVEETTKPVGADTAAQQPEEAAVHIVYTERPEGEEAEANHIRTLSSVLGSEEAAKEALVYVYETAATGFSAKLTPKQVEEIKKQPGVLQVVPSRTLKLHPVGGV